MAKDGGGVRGRVGEGFVYTSSKMLLENSTVLQIVLIHGARARSEGFCAQMRSKKSARNLPCGLTLRGKRKLIGPEHLPIGLLKYLLCRSHKTGQLSYRGTLRKTSVLQLMGHCMSRSALMSSFSKGGEKTSPPAGVRRSHSSQSRFIQFRNSHSVSIWLTLVKKFFFVCLFSKSWLIETFWIFHL